MSLFTSFQLGSKMQHLEFSRFPPYVTSRWHLDKAVSFEKIVFSYDFWQFEQLKHLFRRGVYLYVYKLTIEELSLL